MKLKNLNFSFVEKNKYIIEKIEYLNKSIFIKGTLIEIYSLYFQLQIQENL